MIPGSSEEKVPHAGYPGLCKKLTERIRPTKMCNLSPDPLREEGQRRSIREIDAGCVEGFEIIRICGERYSVGIDKVDGNAA